MARVPPGGGCPPARWGWGWWWRAKCLLPLQTGVLQPWPLSHRGESGAEIGLGELQGGLQLSTSWGSFCSSTLLIGEEGSWEGAGGAWERGPALSEPGDPSLQVCRGGGAAAAAAPPSPVEERSPGRYFGQRLGCLMPDWFYLCCQRDGGEKRGGLRRGLGSAVSPRLRGPCPPSAPCAPSPVCSALEPPEPSPAEPLGVLLAAWRGVRRLASAVGGRQPQIAVPSSGTPLAEPRL